MTAPLTAAHVRPYRLIVTGKRDAAFDAFTVALSRMRHEPRRSPMSLGHGTDGTFSTRRRLGMGNATWPRWPDGEKKLWDEMTKAEQRRASESSRVVVQRIVVEPMQPWDGRDRNHPCMTEDE